MIRHAIGRLLVGAALLAGPAGAGTLTATLPDGTELARLDVPEGSGWCVHWRHSVKGFEVADCYENRAGAMVLVRSHLPDFAAGLDHIPGRGVGVEFTGLAFSERDLVANAVTRSLQAQS